MPIFQYGVDVSRYQGTVDWARVAASGKQFAIVRLGSSGSGGLYIDPYFRQNVDGAHAAGLRVGVYYYSYARTRAQVRRELDTFLPQLKGMKLEYPVFADIEDSSLTSVGRSELTALIRYAMELIDQNGYFPAWYTYTYFAQTYVDAAQLLDYPLWIADYRGYMGYGGAWSMWQYSSGGSVNGITGRCDLDYAYADYLPQIIAAGKNGYSQQESGGPVMEEVSGRLLQVFGSNAEYFSGADTGDPLGYLPAGEYPVVALSLEPYNGYRWITFVLGGQVYWTADLPDRLRIVGEAPGGDPSAEIERLRQQVSALQGKIDDALRALQ